MKMKWYVAHVIMYVKFKDGKQDHYPKWENFHLIRASSPDKAWNKADECGHEAEGDSNNSFRWDNRPATWVYAGTRKLIECIDNPLISGAEVAYSELRLESARDLKKLLKGSRVNVTYVK
jgi:hypothetical protein